MKYCTNCGEKLENKTATCPNCNYVFSSEITSDEVTTISKTDENPSESSSEQVALPTNNSTVHENDNHTTPTTASTISDNETAVISTPAVISSTAADESEKLPVAQTISQNTKETQEHSNGKKSRKKKGLSLAIVAALLFVFVVSGFMFFGFKKLISPKNQMLYYAAKFSNERFQDLTAMSLLKQDKISTDLTLTVQNTGIPKVDEILQDSSLIMRIAGEDRSVLTNYELNLKGSSILNATISLDEEKFGFFVPEADENYYVAKTATLFHLLSDGKITDPSYYFRPSKKDIDTFKKTMEQAFTEAFTKENVQIEKSDEIILPKSQKTFKGTRYTFTPSAEDLQRSMQIVANKIEQDKGFRKLLVRIIVSSGKINDFSYMSLYSPEQLEQELLQMASEIKNDDFFSDFETGDLIWTIATEKDNIRFMALEAPSNTSLYYETTQEKNQVEEYLYVVESYGEEVFSLTDIYTKNAKNYKGRLQVQSNADSFHIDYDIQLGEKFLILPIGSYQLYASQSSTPTASLTVKKGEEQSLEHILLIAGKNQQPIQIHLLATKQSSVTKPIKPPTDITDYDEQQLQSLLDNISFKIGEGLQKVLFDLGSFGGF